MESSAGERGAVGTNEKHNPNIISTIDQTNSLVDSTFHYNNSNFAFTSYTSTQSPKESLIFNVLPPCTVLLLLQNIC